jgi:hypothetical protein
MKIHQSVKKILGDKTDNGDLKSLLLFLASRLKNSILEQVWQSQNYRLHVCMYVCVCVCVCACGRAGVRACVCVGICMYLFMRVMCICMYVRTYVYGAINRVHSEM